MTLRCLKKCGCLTIKTVVHSFIRCNNMIQTNPEMNLQKHKGWWVEVDVHQDEKTEIWTECSKWKEDLRKTENDKLANFTGCNFNIKIHISSLLIDTVEEIKIFCGTDTDLQIKVDSFSKTLPGNQFVCQATTKRKSKKKTEQNVNLKKTD